MDFDVIIIGAGPAGTAAAYRLAEAGLRTLIIDRTGFPRQKPCAGGLTLKALNLMPYSIASILERSTDGMTIGIKNRADAFRAISLKRFAHLHVLGAQQIGQTQFRYGHTKGGRVCNS